MYAVAAIICIVLFYWIVNSGPNLVPYPIYLLFFLLPVAGVVFTIISNLRKEPLPLRILAIIVIVLISPVVLYTSVLGLCQLLSGGHCSLP